MTEGDVSQAFSVRDEHGGTNRLAKYENWMTINGYVLLSAEDNDSVCAPRPRRARHQYSVFE